MWKVTNRKNKVVGIATTLAGLFNVLGEFKRTKKSYEDNFEDDYAVHPKLFGINRATMIFDELVKMQ